MGNCNTTGLLGVIIKVCLSVHICVVTNDLDGVLVGTYCTICTKTPELTVCSSFRSSNRIFLNIQGKICNIIDDTDGKSLFLCVVVYSDDLSRSSILRS